jgi:uncharacterized membrane protein YgcG
MNQSLILCITIIGLVIIVGLLLRLRAFLKSEREAFIRGYPFPIQLRQKLAMLNPHWEGEQMQLALRALRQYFLVCLAADAAGRGKPVGMPSKAVDQAWHEFILMSRQYTEFCRHAFGCYLHHSPESTMQTGMNEALVNTLHRIKTQPGGSTGWAMLGGIPLLFAADRALSVADGFHYDAESLSRLEHRRQLWDKKRGDPGCGVEGVDSGDAGLCLDFGGGGNAGGCGDGGGGGGAGCSGGGGCSS